MPTARSRSLTALAVKVWQRLGGRKLSALRWSAICVRASPEWVIEERDKLTVHPANPFEAAKVGAVLSPPGQMERRVEGIAVFSASHVLIDDIGVRQLGGLASELAKQTAEKAQEQQGSVLAEAQQLNMDSLYRLPPLRMRQPAADAAGDAP